MLPHAERKIYYRLWGGSSVFLLLAVVFLYPHFCDAVDPDATAYFPLARRWAVGDFIRAVNGYWSPFSIWLTALGIKCGFPEIPAAFVQNTAAAIAFLGASFFLFRRFGVEKKRLFYITLALVFFLLHAVFLQWFNDLWGAAFALFALGLLATEDFLARPILWLFYAFLGALAYLSKSVYLPFFLLQTVGTILLRSKEISLQRKLSFGVLSVGMMAILCGPWWMALRAHYGFWTTGVAGPLNLSWGVLGHPIYKGGEGHLLPPLFTDSVSFWEDPWWLNARLIHFWDSPAWALHMIPRVWYFALRLLGKALSISFFLPLVWMLVFYRAFRNRFILEGDFKSRLLHVVLVIFPLPFLLLHSEVRYLWYLVPLTIVFWDRKLSNHLWTGVLALSFYIYPAVDLSNLWHLGRREKALALNLKSKGFSGDFAADSAVGYASALRVAYFSGMRYWAPAGVVPDSLLLGEMQRQGLKYVLHKNGMESVK